MAELSRVCNKCSNHGRVSVIIIERDSTNGIAAEMIHQHKTLLGTPVVKVTQGYSEIYDIFPCWKIPDWVGFTTSSLSTMTFYRCHAQPGRNWIALYCPETGIGIMQNHGIDRAGNRKLLEVVPVSISRGRYYAVDSSVAYRHDQLAISTSLSVLVGHVDSMIPLRNVDPTVPSRSVDPTVPSRNVELIESSWEYSREALEDLIPELKKQKRRCDCAGRYIIIARIDTGIQIILQPIQFYECRRQSPTMEGTQSTRWYYSPETGLGIEFNLGTGCPPDLVEFTISTYIAVDLTRPLDWSDPWKYGIRKITLDEMSALPDIDHYRLEIRRNQTYGIPPRTISICVDNDEGTETIKLKYYNSRNKSVVIICQNRIEYHVNPHHSRPNSDILLTTLKLSPESITEHKRLVRDSLVYIHCIYGRGSDEEENNRFRQINELRAICRSRHNFTAILKFDDDDNYST